MSTSRDNISDKVASSEGPAIPEADTTPPAAVLTCESVEFGYRTDEPVLRGVSACLEKSQLCALVGPNASGKSTLLSVILGIHTPWGGQIMLDGRQVGQLTAMQRAELISYVPQRTRADFAFTVEQVVAIGRHAIVRNPGAVEQALADCDLNALRQRVFMELSVGQQQRVLLARAIAQSHHRGRVMLLDEPTSAMDLEHVHDTMRTLRTLTRSGLSVLVVVHDLNIAAQYADSVWVMDYGQVVAEGPWESVLRPEVLEEVFRVEIKPMGRTQESRPVFTVEPRRKLGVRA